MSACKNCGTALDDVFCPRCGQKDLDLGRPIADLAGERDAFRKREGPIRRWEIRVREKEPSGPRWESMLEDGKSLLSAAGDHYRGLLDREKELIVRAELPGVEKDDVEVTIAGDRLTIEAEREFEEEETKESFYRHELGYGELQRTIALPVQIDAEHIEAELKDGILSVKLPKVQAATRHTVKVA